MANSICARFLSYELITILLCTLVSSVRAVCNRRLLPSYSPQQTMLSSVLQLQEYFIFSLKIYIKDRHYLSLYTYVCSFLSIQGG